MKFLSHSSPEKNFKGISFGMIQVEVKGVLSHMYRYLQFCAKKWLFYFFEWNIKGTYRASNCTYDIPKERGQFILPSCDV